MKRIISLILVTILSVSALFCLAGCGKVNDAEVSIIWSEGDWKNGEGKATIPNSLINSMDRAMYIKKVDYKHYGANGNAETQVELAKKAIENGCQVLVVEMILDITDLFQAKAQEIVNAAKAENVPLIFFNCTVADSIVNSYDKCYIVKSDIENVADIQGKLIADYVKSNFKKLDKNTDGVLSYIGTGVISAAAVKKANELLATKDYIVKTEKKEKINTKIELTTEIDLLKSELIVTESDELAYATLLELQAKDYNTDKLSTHFIPVFTIGENVDYKAMVVSMGKDKYEENKYLVDLTSVKEEDLEAMIYTTINVIDAGRIAGTATEDRDSIALAVAQIVRNICKGNDATKDVASDSVVVDGNIVKVSYIPYTK